MSAVRSTATGSPVEPDVFTEPVGWCARGRSIARNPGPALWMSARLKGGSKERASKGSGGSSGTSAFVSRSENEGVWLAWCCSRACNLGDCMAGMALAGRRSVRVRLSSSVESVVEPEVKSVRPSLASRAFGMRAAGSTLPCRTNRKVRSSGPQHLRAPRRSVPACRETSRQCRCRDRRQLCRSCCDPSR